MKNKYGYEDRLDALEKRIKFLETKKVVSLEWLEEQKDLTQLTISLPDKELNAYLQGKLDFYYDLIEAAEKQAFQKRRGLS